MKKQTVFQALLKCMGYVALFFAVQMAASLLAGFIAGFSVAFSGADFDPIQITSKILYETMILSALLFFGVIALIKRQNLLQDASLHGTPGSSLAAGAFLGFGAYSGANLLIILMSAIPAVQESQMGYMEQQEAIMASNPSFWAEIFYVCLAAPLLEELLCRGLILNTLKKSMAPQNAIFISAIIFAWIHGNLYQVVFTLPLGILMAWLAHRFNSIWPSVLTHVAFNFSNYPARILMELGYGEESAPVTFAYYAVLLFCLFSVPLGILLVRHACTKKAPPEPVFFPQSAPDPYHPYPPFPSQDPTYRPYDNTAPGSPNGSASEGAQSYNSQGGFMAAPEYLIVGLGNPGDKYAQNRHNVGFMALDYIALRENTSIQNLRFKALTGECTLCGKKVLLLKPQTFMNLSGESVREAAAFYKIPPERILVIFDDINFAPGIFRIRENGSAGGHNGIKSIISCLGSDAFPRVKLGVGAPPPQWELMNWVLGNPTPEDQKRIIASLEDVYDSAKHFANGTLDRAAALYNGKMHE